MNEAIKSQGNFCEICGNEAECVLNGAARTWRCPRCGTFQYDSTVGWLDVKTPDHMVRLSGWVREQNDASDESPNITTELSRRVARMRVPGLRERANRALVVIARDCPDLDSWYDPRSLASSLEMQGRSYSSDEAAAAVLVQLLQASGYLRKSPSGLVGISVEVPSRMWWKRGVA